MSNLKYDILPRYKKDRKSLGRKCLTLFYSLIFIGYAKIDKIICLSVAPEGKANSGQAPGVLHHVIGQGIEKNFLINTDRNDFTDRLSAPAQDGKMEIYAWWERGERFKKILESMRQDQ